MGSPEWCHDPHPRYGGNYSNDDPREAGSRSRDGRGPGKNAKSNRSYLLSASPFPP